MNTAIIKMRQLVEQLNRYRDEYYNQASPTVSDAEYDKLFDELSSLEQQTGVYMANSPTQTVGYPVVSNLPKAKHDVPLLSLDKTKSVETLVLFQGEKVVNLSPKLDGLTTEFVYENGELKRASTRGDGDVGEDITHNAKSISGVPMTIPYKKRLVVSGEAFIRNSDFRRLRENLVDSTGKPYKQSRNLAAGSLRLYDSAECAQRCITFIPFSVVEGLDDENEQMANSKLRKLARLADFGFGKLKTIQFTASSNELMQHNIDLLRKKASEDDLPIDGMVLCYDDISYSKSCGRTGHHYKDGLAFKFEDDRYETVLRDIEWKPSRTGEITPVAIFDTVEIDGTDVSRASLHNITFVEKLGLMPGNRILVSKRNMIIPHVEENLDPGNFDMSILVPKFCSCCGAPTRIHVTGGKDVTKTLFCDNPDCGMRQLRKLVHYVSKKAMNIDGLSEASLALFVSKGWVSSYADLYRLDRFRDEIVKMDGYGERSWQRLWEALQNSRQTTFERFLVSMDIPMIGSTASRELGKQFHNSLDDFILAVRNGYDFTALPDFGATLNDNIHNWFKDQNNMQMWEEMKSMMTIEQQNTPVTAQNNALAGLTIVVTGKVEPYTRDEINAKIISLGAKAGSSVTKKTDYLVCGENAGSKLSKAMELGVKVLSPAEFFAMAGE